MSQPNKDNRPEAVLDRVLEKTGVMSQPKSNEGLIKQLKKDCLTRTQLLVWVQQLNFTAEQEAKLEKLVSKIVEDKLYEALAQKDKEVVEVVKESFNHFSWCRECGESPFCREALSIAEKYGVDLTLKE